MLHSSETLYSPTTERRAFTIHIKDQVLIL